MLHAEEYILSVLIFSEDVYKDASSQYRSVSSMAQSWSGGHTAPVLCIGAAAGADGFLASGAEGGEVTVWTQEGMPLAQLRLTSQDDVTCTVFSDTSPGLLYVSHGETVSILDPRNLRKPAEELKDVGEDEINSLSVSETGASLALADDSGAVRVVDLQTGKVSRTLRKHTNICASVAFRPQRPQSLVSAGLDMQVRDTDFTRRHKYKIKTKDGVNKSISQEKQIL